MLTDPRFQKHAFNANFERIALSKWLGKPNGEYLDPENWRCSAIKANANGVFGTLDEVARAVKSPVKKDAEGKRLIRLFSVPDRKAGKFHEPKTPLCWCGADHRPDFAKFEAYCDQDVVTEAMVAAQLPDIPEDVQRQYEADQRINDRGIGHNRRLAESALALVTVEKDRLMGELKALTGVDNPNSGPQMQKWLADQGYPMLSLNKASREEALADPFIPEAVAEALTLKGAASLSSVAKHKAALDTRCEDGRIRGSLRFYGAHTGREAGRGIQPQNLPRYEAPDADRRALAKRQIQLLSDVSLAAKGTVRASLVPARGNVLVVFDYNAIEARCLGWQAGETWVMDEFKTGQGKIYEATAATMFGVDKDALIRALNVCDKCGKCADCNTRGKGKVSNLALGYAGGAGALVTMGAEKEGIDVGNYNELHREWEGLGKPGKFHEWERDRHDYPELIRLRDAYRDASPMTVRFWKLCAKAWDMASDGKGVRFGPDQSISMIRDGYHNRLILPSGRSIWYRFGKSHTDPNNPDRIDRRTFIGKGKGVGHMRVDTHGGKLTENITQAVARDVLFDLMMKVEAMTAKGWPGKIVLHVHDEVALEVPERHAQRVYDDMDALMQIAPDWAPGLPVKGAGAIMLRYGK
jgi:DNA polymerase